MSWLLVAVVPTLLMLATVGLERIETGLSGPAPVAQSAEPPTNPQFRLTGRANRV